MSKATKSISERALEARDKAWKASQTTAETIARKVHVEMLEYEFDRQIDEMLADLDNFDDGDFE